MNPQQQQQLLDVLQTVCTWNREAFRLFQEGLNAEDVRPELLVLLSETGVEVNSEFETAATNLLKQTLVPADTVIDAIRIGARHAEG